MGFACFLFFFFLDVIREVFEETLFGEASGEKLLRIQLWPTR